MTSDAKSRNDAAGSAFTELAEIIRRLRAPGGCPWDRKQTPKSLKSFIVEETYEVLDAIDNENPGEICEELGDLLLQIILQAEIGAEQGQFTIEDVVRGLSKKLIHRHPHVFGDTSVENADEVLVNWEQLKKEEKENRGLFDGLPRHLPSLQRASRMGEKATRVGFDWPDAKSVRDKVQEELDELDEAVSRDDPESINHELGDLLFAIAQWARHLGEQPEEVLAGGCKRFVRRFSRMEQIAADTEQPLNDLNLEELEQLWQQTKE
ncbi:MAG: nucleoside triphosphate pyrophosphohydrolase [Proteobacteria bacterium]|nr:nucleoside triphosphate pyrophosphohydrolase [Pseudomonadota bacterium]